MDLRFSVEEMQRVHERDVFVKQALAERLAHTIMENLELAAIVSELQSTLVSLRDDAIDGDPVSSPAQE